MFKVLNEANVGTMYLTKKVYTFFQYFRQRNLYNTSIKRETPVQDLIFQYDKVISNQMSRHGNLNSVYCDFIIVFRKY